MTCAYSPNGDLVACGGLDNLCSVYKIPGANSAKDTSAGQQRTYAELAQHEGYLSCCRFIRDDEIITSSGDSTCILWDVEVKTPKCIFNDHTGDVMSVSIFDGNDSFVSGSCDATAKLWDHRQGQGKNCVKTFAGTFDCLLACLPVCLLACLPVYLFACLPVYLLACLSACLFICLPVYLLVCLSACLPVCLSACLLVCLPACLFACLLVLPFFCLFCLFFACFACYCLLLSFFVESRHCFIIC
jgi:hypothetical protein